MNRSLSLVVLLLIVSSVWVTGCQSEGQPPDSVSARLPDPPPLSPFNTPSAIAVDKNDSAELAAVTEMEKDRSNYKYCLVVLASYYHKIGNMDKEIWAKSEYKNLDEAKKFQWENVPEIQAPAGESLENADERDLVERAVAARNKYIADTEAVVRLLEKKSDTYKASVIRNMQVRLDPVRLYPYFPDSMLPPRDLTRR